MSKRELLARVLSASGLGWLLRRLPSWEGLLVLNYHRIGEGRATRRDPWDPDLVSASAEELDAQLRFFKAELDVIHADDLPTALKSRGRFAQITFDDGYRDGFEVAFPVLRANGVSATFFVTSGFLDHGGVPWWDELAWMTRPRQEGPAASDSWRKALHALDRACGVLGDPEREAFLDSVGATSGLGRCPRDEGRDLWMTWDMVRALERGGMTIGGHTSTHPRLSRLSPARQLEEIAGGKARIEAEIGKPIQLFAYPFGAPTCFDAASRAAVKEAGFTHAYSQFGGFQPRGTADPLALKRVAIETWQSHQLHAATASAPFVFA